MRKATWIVIGIVIILIVIFFFPKSCGGGGGTGGPWTSIDCNCIGFTKIKNVHDASFTSCFGICLKNTCENKINWGRTEIQCQKDSDCVSQCSRGCVNSLWALSNPDNSECFRAWDCTCGKGMCYTDGELYS